MRMGWALPLAVAAPVGIGAAWQAPPGLLEAWALAILLVGRNWRRLALLLVVAATAWPVLHAATSALPDGLTGEDLQLEGRLLQVDSAHGITRLLVSVEACAALMSPRPGCDTLRRVRLSQLDENQQTNAPSVGERWRFTVRLRPPSGFANPHAFDYGAWLWREGIDATGYVRSEPAAERLSTANWSLRRQALGHLDQQLGEGLAPRWLAALTLGAGERLTSEDWALLNATGTTHLMVISGLHVGLVATFTLVLGRWAARLLAPGKWRMVTWPWWLAGAAAVSYAALAGFAPPAQRAMLMTLIGLWVASGRHAPGPWQAWWLALALILILDPLALWRPGLWLSFVAVALLIVIWQGRQRLSGISGGLWSLLRLQLLLEPMMAAAVLVAFNWLAPASPLANLFAVPLVSMLMVPLGLLGWLLVWFAPLSTFCWWLFSWLAELLHGLLAFTIVWIPAWQPSSWQRWPLALTLLLFSICWALPGLAWRLRLAVSLLLISVPLTLKPPQLAAGTLEVLVHDVGQGQLVDLRTANHRLLYDTGPRFRSGFMPLESLWARPQHFDRVIVSHGDIDHAGGVPALDVHHVGDVMAPWGDDIGVAFQPCQRGQQWRWDEVDFHVLWPPAGDNREWSSNDRSCVLLVETGEQRLLLTGDVGRQVERYFLRDVPAPLTLLVAGHHGSHTSSGPQLVSMLNPQQVVYSAGRNNPYAHPSPEVVRRMRYRCQWSTALDGALHWRLGVAAPATVQPMRNVTEWRGAVGDGCHGVESAPLSRPSSNLSSRQAETP